MTRNVDEDRIERVIASPEAVTRALARGVREALERHRQADLPVAVWRNGRVEWVPPGRWGPVPDGAGRVADKEQGGYDK